MARVWIVCALAAVGVVILVLLFGDSRTPGGGPKHGPRAPSPLSEQEVRTYVEVWPQFRMILEQTAADFQRARVEGRADDPAFGIATPAKVDALLERYHLTRETWKTLSDRVEYGVHVLRTGNEMATIREDVEKEIELKRELLKKLALPEERAKVEEEIRAAEARISGETLPLLEQDRELIRQYWRDLDRIVPRRGAPPKQR